jgi:hypothetical protein
MKLNLPFALTNRKISTLLLLVLLNTQNTNADPDVVFTMCLENPDSGLPAYSNYALLSNFGKNLTDRETFCCDFQKQECFFRSSSPCSPNIVSGQCANLEQQKFCVTSGWSLVNNPPSGLCGGTLEDYVSHELNNITIGNCPDSKLIGDALRGQELFAWVCCDNNLCTIQGNVSIRNNNSATTPSTCFGQNFLMCFFTDPQVWRCTGSVIDENSPNRFSLDISRPIGSCILQIKLNMSYYESETVFPPSIPRGLRPNEKIAISVGSTIGAVSISGTICYVIHRERRKKDIQSIKNLMSLLIDRKLKKEMAEKTSNLFKT